MVGRRGDEKKAAGHLDIGSIKGPCLTSLGRLLILKYPVPRNTASRVLGLGDKDQRKATGRAISQAASSESDPRGWARVGPGSVHLLA